MKLETSKELLSSTCTATWQLQHVPSQEITDKYNKNEAFLLAKHSWLEWMQVASFKSRCRTSTMCADQWSFVSIWWKLIHFYENMHEKQFLHFCSHWLWPWTFRPQNLLPSTHVSAKLEVSIMFLFREHQRHGTNERTDKRTDKWTDRQTGATHNVVPRKGHIINTEEYTSLIIN